MKDLSKNITFLIKIIASILIISITSLIAFFIGFGSCFTNCSENDKKLISVVGLGILALGFWISWKILKK